MYILFTYCVILDIFVLTLYAKRGKNLLKLYIIYTIFINNNFDISYIVFITNTCDFGHK